MAFQQQTVVVEIFKIYKITETYSFIKTSELYNYFALDEWQKYEEIKENYENDESEFDQLAWYDFHNVMTGNSKFLLLADLKGQKEDFYVELHAGMERKLRQQTADEKEVSDNVKVINMDSRPSLKTYVEASIALVVNTFDTKETKNEYQYYKEITSNYNENDEYYLELFTDLLELNEMVPIEAHDNIKVAIEQAHKNYFRKKISEHLPMAYEQYTFNLQMGLMVKKESEFLDIRENYFNMILDGREINGEARDFNY